MGFCGGVLLFRSTQVLETKRFYGSIRDLVHPHASLIASGE